MEGQTGEERWPPRVMACRLGESGGAALPGGEGSKPRAGGHTRVTQLGCQGYMCSRQRGWDKGGGGCSMTLALQVTQNVRVTDSLTQAGHQPALILRPWQG